MAIARLNLSIDDAMLLDQPDMDHRIDRQAGIPAGASP
jgi:hypothetical protein